MSDLVRYGPEVKELAFACYVQADRNISRATRLLAERLGEEPCPDRSVVSKWAKEGAWEAKAVEAVAEAFPHLQFQDMTRLALLRGKGLDIYFQVLNRELDDCEPRLRRDLIEVADKAILASGLGAYAGRSLPEHLALPQLPAKSVNDADAALSPQERQRRRLDAERET